MLTPLDLLLHQLDSAYLAKAWHGPTLRGALRGVRAETAAWRPGPGRHSIWELALHCAYWKYTVRRRLTGEKRGAFPLEGSNFFPRPLREPNQRDWAADVALLDAEHRALRAAVAALEPDRLGEKAPGARYSYATLASGIAAHDLYHAGQISLLKRLAPP